MLSDYNDTRNKFSAYLDHFGKQAESEGYAFSVKYKKSPVAQQARKINAKQILFSYF